MRALVRKTLAVIGALMLLAGVIVAVLWCWMQYHRWSCDNLRERTQTDIEAMTLCTGALSCRFDYDNLREIRRNAATADRCRQTQL